MINKIKISNNNNNKENKGYCVSYTEPKNRTMPSPCGNNCICLFFLFCFVFCFYILYMCRKCFCTKLYSFTKYTIFFSSFFFNYPNRSISFIFALIRTLIHSSFLHCVPPKNEIIIYIVTIFLSFFYFTHTRRIVFFLLFDDYFCNVEYFVIYLCVVCGFFFFHSLIVMVFWYK